MGGEVSLDINFRQEFFIANQVTGSRVEVDTHLIDTTHHRLVERVLELRLVNIVLVLSDTDTLRVNLHKLSERVHQSSADGYGSTCGDVFIGELLASYG